MKNTLIFLVSLLFSVCFAQQQKPFAAGVDVFGGYSWNDRVYQVYNERIIGDDERLYGANLFATYKAHTLSGGFCSGLQYAKQGYQVQYRYCLKQFFRQRLSVSLGVGYQKRSSDMMLTQQAQAHAHIAYRLVKGLELTAQGTIGKGKIGIKVRYIDLIRNIYRIEDNPLMQFNVGLKYALVQR